MKYSGWSIATISCVLIYTVLVVIFSDPFPKLDDLHDCFQFFILYHQAPDLLGKLHSFFYPNNEHVTAINHLIYWIQWQLFGELNFQVLVWIGNIFIISTAIVASRLVPGNSKAIQFFIICSYLSFAYWDSSFKAMTALSNQSVILFAAISCLMIQQRQWLLATLFVILAQFSQSNGLLMWPILIIAAYLNDKNLPRTATLAAIGCISVASYLHLQSSFTTTSTLLQTSVFSLLSEKPLLPLFSVLNMLSISALPTPELMRWLLVVMTSTILIWLVYKRSLCIGLLSFMAFIVITAAAIATNRGLAYQSADAILVSRYAMYSLLFFTLPWACWLVAYPRKTLIIAANILVILLFIASTRYLPHVIAQTNGVSNSINYWLVDGDLRRAEFFHIDGSDSYYFAAEYLQVWNPFRSVGITPLAVYQAADSQSCPSTTELAFCPTLIVQRMEGISAQVIGNQQFLAGAQLHFCGPDAPSFTSEPIPEQRDRLFINRARMSQAYDRAILTKNHTKICQIPLSWSARSREAHLQDLFAKY